MRTLIVVLLLALPLPLVAQTVFRSGFEAGETAPPPPAAKSGLGINLETVIDFAVAYPFTDLFKQSRPWITSAPNGCTPPDIPGASCFDTLEADLLDLDAEGWVRTLPACDDGGPTFCIARTVINSAEAPYPRGTYLVLYDGDGDLEYGGAARLDVAASTPGRDVVNVDSDGIWILSLTRTNPASPLRNIRVLAPGFDPALAEVPRFHPDFLAELAPYRSIRFMDWAETNGGGFDGGPNSQENFSDRPLVSTAHWSTKKGVPLEVMIELANTTGAEPWFTLPHRVNDDYVSQFAGLVRQQLASGRRVYVEYSNEVWNPAFPQGNEIEQRGIDELLPPGCAVNQDERDLQACPSNFTLRLNQHGRRTAEICTLFKAAFADEASRVTCVLGAQAANAFTQTEAADCPLAIQAGRRQTPCHEPMDAVAIAPYFANYTNVPANEAEIQGWSLDQLFAELTDGGQLAQNVSTPCTDNGPFFAGRVEGGRCTVPALEEVTFWIDSQFETAQERGLTMLAYEGGQHLVGVFGVQNNQAITDLFVAANRDPRMGAIYQDYLADWKARGGELFAVFALSFSYGRFGSWGMIEQLGQSPRPPKAAAIDAFNASNPCWWMGCEQ